MRLPEFIWNQGQVSEAKTAHVAAAMLSGAGDRPPGWSHSPCHMLCVAGLLLTSFCVALAENPCGSVNQRALVLGGGGVKGAFEAGAVYHLVVHRRCDFHEFSGVSVGALNATFLAQAAQETDPSESYANLADQSEALVSLWMSLRSSRDVARSRLLATVRFGVFGLDSLADFTPLRRLEDKNVALERIFSGRPLRIGVVSFYDGEYQEILAKSLLSEDAEGGFRDYLTASSTPPVLGKLLVIREGTGAAQPQQFADGSLRHMTPAGSYFAACKPSTLLAHDAPTSISGGPQLGTCPARDHSVPTHEPIQQLFVVATSPYNRYSEASPVLDPKCCRPGTRQITDGRKILGRTLALLDDEVYRRDLDFLLSANDALAWRWHVYQQLILGASPEQTAEVKQRFRTAPSFAFESYNRDPEDTDAPSRPYEIGLIVPNKEFADLNALISVSPQSVQEQLYCGCVAADQTMQEQFGLPSLIGKCAERFTRLTRASQEPLTAETQFDPSVCQGTSKPESQRRSLAAANAESLDQPALRSHSGSIRTDSPEFTDEP